MALQNFTDYDILFKITKLFSLVVAVRMEISHIEEFAVLADICNYGRAADKLFISQSSLFNHIKTLEAELGVPLFNRKGKNIVLSDYGQIFLPYAKTIISTAKEYVQVLQTNQDKSAKKLQIGTQYRVTELIKEFSKQHREYEVHVFDNYSAMDALDEGICELAFIRDISEAESLVYNAIPYITDSFVAVVYSSHPLAKKPRVRLRDLKNEDFVMISRPQEQECSGMKLCKRAGFIPHVSMTAVNGSEAARLVDEEVGISLFLKSTIISENFQNLALIDLDPPIDCAISLCWRKDKKLSPAAKAFVTYVKERSEAKAL